MLPSFRPLKFCGDRYQSNSEWLKHHVGYHIVYCQSLVEFDQCFGLMSRLCQVEKAAGLRQCPEEHPTKPLLMWKFPHHKQLAV